MYEACLGMLQTMVVKLVMDGKISKFNLGNFSHPDFTLSILQEIDGFPILKNQRLVLEKP
tara:strand:- start:54 stop:233 length:180 start_codon:yes stop_codon:yes gene_type:complete